MTDQKKLQEIAALVARWQDGGISDMAAMIVIADLVAPQPVTAADVQWGQDRVRQVEEAAEYDRRREK